MILFIGQVGRTMRGREAFQEIDFRRMFGEMAKWIEEIDSADRVTEVVSRAFYEATSGRPGPVVLSLPEDMLRETTARANPKPWAQVETHPGLTQMAELQKMLWRAKSPFVIAGGPRWSEAAVAGLRRFAERFQLPVGCSLRRQALFDNEHPNYAGDVGIGINPDARQAREGSRPAAADRRPHERDAVVGLYADRYPRAEADAGARPSRRRGTRPALSAGARHQRQPDRFCRCAGGIAAAERNIRGPALPRPRTTPISAGRRRR